MQNVVIKTVALVPKFGVFVAEIVHRVGNINEMLEKFARHIFVNLVFFGEFERNCQHIQTIHRHPRSAVRLFEMSAGRQFRVAVENADIVQAEKSAFKNIVAFRRLCD